MKDEERESVFEKLCEQIEEQIKKISEQQVQQGNVEYLYKLMDIHKDIKNELYWKEKIENMYNEYGRGSYGRRGVRGSGRGRYREYNAGGNYRENYGRRGVDSRYRGEEAMDGMYQAYNDYMDDAEYGNYGTNESMEKIEIMADSLMDFVEHIKKAVKTPEEKQLIDKKIQELSNM